MSKHIELLSKDLERRYNELYNSDVRIYPQTARYLIDFIRTTPPLRATVKGIAEALPELNPSAWVQLHLKEGNTTMLPSTEVGRAKVSWHLLQEWAARRESPSELGRALIPVLSAQEAAAYAAQQMIKPFIAYLQSELNAHSNVLYLLERYTRCVEWFDRQRLWEMYLLSLDSEKSRHQREVIYDTDLRRFLFTEGIDFPFSQPQSPTGKADILYAINTADPMVCEVKLFDADSYGRAYVAKGFRQAKTYAKDHEKSTAYLVIFNLSEKHLELSTMGPENEWPPRVYTETVTVYMVVIRARPMPAASQQPKIPTVVITVEDLLESED